MGNVEAIGDMMTGTLAARAVEPTHGNDHAHAGPAACLNCGTTLTGEFCHHCGQARHVHRTLTSIGHDLAHGVWHFDGKIWNTLPMLFLRPGELTRRYCAGERARFVSPLALFLFSVFLMVATFGSIGGPIGSDDVRVNHNGMRMTQSELTAELERQKTVRSELVATRDALRTKGAATAAVDAKIATVAEAVTGLETAQKVTQGSIIEIDKSDIATGSQWLDQRLQRIVKEPKLYLYKLQTSAYKYSWALIPISIPFIWLLFAFRRDVGPYDHAIFAIYSLSAMTLGVVALSVGKAIGLSSGVIEVVLTFGPPLHMYKQLRGAYGLRRASALWRTVALLVFSFVAALMFFAVLIGIIAD